MFDGWLLIASAITYAAFLCVALWKRFELRQVFALLIAPFAAAIAATFVGKVPFLVAMSLTYVGSLAGLPAYVLIRRFGWFRLGQIISIAFALGIAVGILVFGFEWLGLLLFAGYAALVGAIFWLVAFAPVPTAKFNR